MDPHHSILDPKSARRRDCEFSDAEMKDMYMGEVNCSQNYLGLSGKNLNGGTS